jgi:tRNA (cytidine/uridine-2'-O-)-methyltransferase
VHVLLVHPEIAPNTGAIVRLCANTGAALHLVEPLGFVLDDARMRRGGLDYHEAASMTVHASLREAQVALPGRWFGFSSRSTTSYVDVEFGDDDVLVFGAERAGLTDEAISAIPPAQMLTIPMRPGNRSINLANAVSIVVYEAWRQRGFDGAGPNDDGLTSETLLTTDFDS